MFDLDKTTSWAANTERNGAWIFIDLKKYYELRHFPPGPPSLPIVGCVPFLPFKEGARNMMASVNWIPKYGDIIGLKFETQKMVFVQSFSKAKEMAFNEKFAGRVKNSHFINHVR